MEKIDITTYPTIRQVRHMHWMLFWMSNWGRSLYVMPVGVLIAVLLCRDPLIPASLVIGASAVAIAVWFFFAIRFATAAGRYHRALQRHKEKNGREYMDERGVGYTSDTYEWYMHWEEFGYLLETGRLLFLIFKGRHNMVTIFKENLDRERLGQIEKLLKSSSLPRSKFGFGREV